jgi:predicted ATPase/class 3 adenylate cyclase
VRVAAGDPPSGVVTFLFTDIEGSTRRWEADAEVMRAALSKHDQVLQTAIESHDGFLFSRTGDGVVAAFASPRSAVDAAVKAQLALELPVRMGIATGEAELRDGDYFGTVLNRAARVMAAGHGGQILVADSTAGLLSGVDLLDLGPRKLRDVPMPVGVFQVQAAELRAEFPPLRALDTTPGNLRPATTSLIGRETEVAEIAAALKAHRLVTLTGVGGVGKTRLALEVAARLVDEFPDGVWVFELAAVTDPAAVPDAVAAVLGIIQQPGKTVSESVAAALEGRVRLLVFDNCEHVVDSVADLVEAILAASTTVKILATSREGLGVADEQLWLVPSLDVGAGIESAAANLFIDRARSVDSGFLVADQAAAVVEVCSRLDGIPLAIELAASRVASMTAGEISHRLDDRFRLLVGSRRGLGRHQTLRQAVAWSYELLDDAEKVLLDRLSIFVGGFDLESACAVAASEHIDDLAVLDLLDALVRKSLLVANRSSGRTRFSMLETIRQFAEERLVASGVGGEVRTAHARYFADRESDILALWDSPRQREAYEWFVTEFANLRAAFRWVADQNDLDPAAAIATYSVFLGMMVENHEPIAWAEEVIEPATAADHRRLATLCVMASACYVTGRIEESLRYSQAAERALVEGRDEVPYGRMAWSLGGHMAAGKLQQWIDFCRAELTRNINRDVFTRACLVMALAMVKSPHEASAAAEGLIEAGEATRNAQQLSYALHAYAFANRDANPVSALTALRRGLVVARDSGNRYNESNLLAMLCRLEADHGEPAAAFDYSCAAIGRYHDSGNITMMRIPLAVAAALSDRFGRHEAAATIAGFAVHPLIAVAYPEFDRTVAHLRDALGDETYESFAHKGEMMATAEMVAYAYEQIDQARKALADVSK